MAIQPGLRVTQTGQEAPKIEVSIQLGDQRERHAPRAGAVSSV